MLPFRLPAELHTAPQTACAIMQPIQVCLVDDASGGSLRQNAAPKGGEAWHAQPPAACILQHHRPVHAEKNVRCPTQGPKECRRMLLYLTENPT